MLAEGSTTATPVGSELNVLNGRPKRALVDGRLRRARVPRIDGYLWIGRRVPLVAETRARLLADPAQKIYLPTPACDTLLANQD